MMLLMQCRAYRYLLDVCEVEMADSLTIDLVFDHAVQYYRNHSQYAETTIYTGDAVFGYVTDEREGARYTLELYYRISDDVLAYKTPEMFLNNITVEGYFSFLGDRTITNNPLSYTEVVGNTRFVEKIFIDYDVNSEYSAISSNGVRLYRNYRDRNVGLQKWRNATYLVVILNPKEYYHGTIHNIEDSILSVNAEPLDFNTQNVFPVNVNCRNDRTINVTWDYTNPRDYVDAEGINPLYYPAEATVTVTQGQTVKTYSTTESDITCPIPANELTPGEATYKVTLTSNYGYSFDSPEQTFTAIGQTSAPEITNITQNSFPTITWSCADQAAWELLIRNNNSVVYHSDMKAGTEQSFTLPVMLEDGSYSVEMRALNIYGYYTDWGSYGFALSPEKPTAATNLIVSTNANYTVTIDCTAPEDAGTLYVVRRRTPNDKAEIIGEYNNGFTDYYVPVNTTYEYAVRNYVTGYADTDFIDATIKCPGVVIRDGEDLSRFIPLWKNDNEEFDVISNNSRSDTLVQCLGRKYPVNEIGEWLTSTRTFTAHVSSSDMLKLNDININSKCVYLQNKDECIPCKMEINDAGEYNGGGRIINFTLTRIDEEMA